MRRPQNPRLASGVGPSCIMPQEVTVIQKGDGVLLAGPFRFLRVNKELFYVFVKTAAIIVLMCRKYHSSHSVVVRYLGN